MKVEVGNLWNAVDAVQATSTDSTRSTSSKNASESGSDNAELSPAAVLAGSLHQQLDGVSETRQARVEALRGQVQQGTYRIAPEQIANAMRDDLSGLSRSLRSRS